MENERLAAEKRHNQDLTREKDELIREKMNNKTERRIDKKER
jgi:hypothetical protein